MRTNTLRDHALVALTTYRLAKALEGDGDGGASRFLFTMADRLAAHETEEVEFAHDISTTVTMIFPGVERGDGSEASR